MVDFRTLMQVDEESDYYRMFKGFEVGDLWVSVQGSKSHYCYPRMTVDLYDYSSFEVALFDMDGSWINPIQDERFKGFNRLEDIENVWQDSDVAVGGYVSLDLIQGLCEYIENL